MIKFEYDAGSFTDVAYTDLGIRLWEFLNEERSIIRLEAATELRRPALEALQSQLLFVFGEKIKERRYKQMIGHMTRQIMEQCGFSLDQTSVRIRTGELFTTAARYTRNGYFPLYVSANYQEKS